MELYKVRAVVTKLARSPKHNAKREYEFETVIVNHLERAKEIYNSQLKKCKYLTQYANTVGFCELFIPKIHDNGEIAYYPNDEKTYIERWEK